MVGYSPCIAAASRLARGSTSAPAFDEVQLTSSGRSARSLARDANPSARRARRGEQQEGGGDRTRGRRRTQFPRPDDEGRRLCSPYHQSPGKDSAPLPTTSNQKRLLTQLNTRSCISLPIMRELHQRGDDDKEGATFFFFSFVLRVEAQSSLTCPPFSRPSLRSSQERTEDGPYGLPAG